ncbi:MAG: class I SAM-dependent methyltransferase [Candidatus Asgardarchaeia archaeon]
MKHPYPKIERYKILYARFLQGDRSKQLMDLAGDFKDKVFLDICCGEGLLTLEAIKRQAKLALAVDSNPQMWGKRLDKIDKVFTFSQKIEAALVSIKEGANRWRQYPRIDIAICQQGINYWLDEEVAVRMANVMNDKGVFIFNTFNEKPSNSLKIEKYNLNNKNYIEITWRSPNISTCDIQHVQICEGYPSHTTQFMWLSDEYIRCCLQKYFDIELIKDGKTSIYKCTRKEKI